MPIILGWIALIAVLNIVVPQLEDVGQMRSVSMSPDDAPSVIAMKRVGDVFQEFDSDSSAMIVLEGEQPLGDDAHHFYDELVDKLEADTKHVEHVQDFWGDPLTAAGAQSNDGKAAYVQVYLAGNQGEALANESVEAVQQHRRRACTPPPGVKAYVTGPAALAADQHIAGDRSMQMIEAVTFGVIIVMLLLVYRSIVTVLLMLVMVVARAGRGARHRRVPRLPRHHRPLDLRDQPAGHAGDRRRDRLRDLPDRPISGSREARRGPGSRVLHDVPRHGARRAGFGPDHRRRDVLPALHPAAVLPDAGRPAGGRHGRRRRRGADAGARGHHRRQPVRRCWNPSARCASRGWRRIGTAVVRWPGPILVATIALSLVGLLTLPGYQTNYNDRNYLPADLPANEGYAAADRHFSAARMNPELLMIESDHDLRNSGGLPGHRQDRQGHLPGARHRPGPGHHPARGQRRSSTRSIPFLISMQGTTQTDEPEVHAGPHGRHAQAGRRDADDHRHA